MAGAVLCLVIQSPAAEAGSGRSAQAKPSPAPETLAVVDAVAQRLASYPKAGKWRAKARSTTSRMTAAWTPKSTVTADKIVTVDGPLWTEDILSATETEDGKTRDVTAKYRDEARERAEKQKRASAKDRENDQRSRGRRSLDMARDEILPFSPDRRAGYDFAVEGTADLDGIPVILLRSRSRVRSDERLEGLYYVSPNTFDVLRAELTLAKRPAPLKRMEIEIDLAVLPEGHQVMTRAVMRVHVGVIVKNIRVEAVETYSDHIVGF
jgi:hypothetical protein